MPSACACATPSSACEHATGHLRDPAGPRNRRRLEVLALEVLHHHVSHAAVEHPDVHDGRDVLAADHAARAPRSRSAAAPGARDVRHEDLHRNELVQNSCFAAKTTPIPPRRRANIGTCPPAPRWSGERSWSDPPPGSGHGATEQCGIPGSWAGRGNPPSGCSVHPHPGQRGPRPQRGGLPGRPANARGFALTASAGPRHR